MFPDAQDVPGELHPKRLIGVGVVCHRQRFARKGDDAKPKHRIQVSFRGNPLICETFSTKDINELGRNRQKVYMISFTSNVEMSQLGTNSTLLLL